MSVSLQVRLISIIALFVCLGPHSSPGAERKPPRPAVMRVDASYWVKGQTVDQRPAGTFPKGAKVEVVSEFRDGETLYQFVRLVKPEKGKANGGWVVADDVTTEASGVAVPAGDRGFHLPPVSDKMNDIGFEGLRRGVGDGRTNALISPYGIWANLTVLQQGARGASADEIAKLIGTPEAGSRPFASTEFRSIDALIKRPDVTLTDTFQAYSANRGVQVQESEFDEAARQVFNSWVKQETNSLIPEFYSAVGWQDIKEAKALVVNVASLRADWSIPFEKSQLKVDFWLTPDERIKVDAMSARRPMAWFGSNPWNADGVILPYKEGELAAIVVVPRDKSGLHGLLDSLKGPEFLEQFTRMPRDLKSLPNADVSLILPKLNLVDELRVDEVLDLKSLTSDSADLSGIFADGGVKISRIDQKTRLEVDEEGTKAASVTASVAKPSSIDATTPKIVNADRPFLFCVTHWPSRSILFAAAVFHPRPDVIEKK